MKVNNPFRNIGERSNPTMETQEEILQVIQKSQNPISLTRISRISKKGFYETKKSVAFLNRLGVVEVIITSNNMTLVKMKGDTNATN